MLVNNSTLSVPRGERVTLSSMSKSLLQPLAANFTRNESRPLFWKYSSSLEKKPCPCTTISVVRPLWTRRWVTFVIRETVILWRCLEPVPTERYVFVPPYAVGTRMHISMAAAVSPVAVSVICTFKVAELVCSLMARNEVWSLPDKGAPPTPHKEEPPWWVVFKGTNNVVMSDAKPHPCTVYVFSSFHATLVTSTLAICGTATCNWTVPPLTAWYVLVPLILTHTVALSILSVNVHDFVVPPKPNVAPWPPPTTRSVARFLGSLPHVPSNDDSLT